MRPCRAYPWLALRTDRTPQRELAGWGEAAMTKLWQKGYSLNEQVERFEGALNSALDNSLIRHDVWGSLAHAAMLKKIGLLNEAEHSALKQALRNILKLEQTGSFTVLPADEDVHTSVENYLVAEAGAAGEKKKTGRPRQEQVWGE